MKLLFSIVAGLMFLTVQGQNQINIKISGQIFNVSEEKVHVSQYDGAKYTDFLEAPLVKGENNNFNFTISGTLPNPDYYVIRFGKTHLNLILRNNADLKIYSDGKNITAYSNIVGSDESKNLNEFVLVLENWRAKQESAQKQMNEHPEQAEEINQSMVKEYYSFQSTRQQFIAKNANSAALIGVISTFNLETEFSIYESVVTQLLSAFGDSPTVKQVQKNYLAIKAQKDAANAFAPGKQATNFKGLKPDGKELSLSDLKGKVVLIDFWASWCGPCRKENPNVVNLYKQYQKDGFTVMSVSLDTDKTKWEAAIQADGLIWPNHVSDLKGWQSEIGKLYQVSGIPFTVLIDKEGKIIKTNLRGPALEEELKRIFGH